MPLTSIATLPDRARVWVFGASAPILGEDAETLLASVDAFLRHWNAHGTPVVAGLDWRYDRFLIVAADEEASGVSGCSIDALFRVLKACEDELGVTMLDSSIVHYRDPDGTVQSASREEFRELASRADVGDETIVFDNTVGLLGAIRNGEWERPMRESWHARAFCSSRRRGSLPGR